MVRRRLLLICCRGRCWAASTLAFLGLGVLIEELLLASLHCSHGDWLMMLHQLPENFIWGCSTEQKIIQTNPVSWSCPLHYTPRATSVCRVCRPIGFFVNKRRLLTLKHNCRYLQTSQFPTYNACTYLKLYNFWAKLCVKNFLSTLSIVHDELAYLTMQCLYSGSSTPRRQESRERKAAVTSCLSVCSVLGGHRFKERDKLKRKLWYALWPTRRQKGKKLSHNCSVDKKPIWYTERILQQMCLMLK